MNSDFIVLKMCLVPDKCLTRLILVLIISCFSFNLTYANYDFKIYYEKIDKGYNVYVDNNEPCPISIKMEYTLTNLGISYGKAKLHVIEGSTKRALISTLKVIKKGAYKFSYRYFMNYGDYRLNSYDKDYEYFLPYRSNNQFEIHQGYDGTISHQNVKALDFSMPVGTEITAIREGIVVKVVDHNTKRCGSKECEKFNNIILIYHPDGTFAEYLHLKRKGSKVKKGDTVVKGQLIGYSGNVGRSNGPHLHLVVFLQRIKSRDTLATKFLTGNGEQSEYLVKGDGYLRNY